MTCQCARGVVENVAACHAGTHCCGGARVVCAPAAAPTDDLVAALAGAGTGRALVCLLDDAQTARLLATLLGLVSRPVCQLTPEGQAAPALALSMSRPFPQVVRLVLPSPR